MQHVQKLRPELDVERRHAREIAAGLVEARNQPRGYRINAGDEDDRDRRRRELRRRHRGAVGDDNRDPLANELDRQCRQPIVTPIRPAIFDRDVAALGIFRFVQRLAEGAQMMWQEVR